VEVGGGVAGGWVMWPRRRVAGPMGWGDQVCQRVSRRGGADPQRGAAGKVGTVLPMADWELPGLSIPGVTRREISRASGP